MTNKIHRTAEVLERRNVSRATLYNHMTAGTFPRPDTPDPGWTSKTLDAFFDNPRAWIEKNQAKIAAVDK